MTEAKHTDGPWKALQSPDGEHCEIWSTSVEFGHLICAFRKYEDEDVDNAFVMAAAPEMLETLEWILDGGWNDGPGSWTTLERRVEEVIAKAKGEA